MCSDCEAYGLKKHGSTRSNCNSKKVYPKYMIQVSYTKSRYVPYMKDCLVRAACCHIPRVSHWRPDHWHAWSNYNRSVCHWRHSVTPVRGGLTNGAIVVPAGVLARRRAPTRPRSAGRTPSPPGTTLTTAPAPASRHQTKNANYICIDLFMLAFTQGPILYPLNLTTPGC